MEKKELDISWFDLKKYENLDDLAFDGWIRQFIMRKETIDEYESVDEEHCDEYKCHVEEVYFHTFKDKPVDFEKIAAENRVFSDLLPCSTPSVNPITPPSLVKLLDDEAIIDAIEIYDSFGEYLKTPIPREPVPPDWLFTLTEPISFLVDYSQLHLSADLGYSDEHIINDLHRCLSEYRKMTGMKPYRKKISENDMKKWIKYKVLPYIDLVTVAMIEDKTITQVEIAKLLFDDDHDISVPTETLRKTTKPEAERLMDLFDIPYLE